MEYTIKYIPIEVACIDLLVRYIKITVNSKTNWVVSIIKTMCFLLYPNIIIQRF